MTDDIDRILRVRVVAEGLPLTPGKNPWRTRAASGLALVLAYGADGEAELVGPPPGDVPIVVGVSYSVVDTGGGGERVVVEVDDSTGCTTITAGAVAFTSFAIDDATHVSGVPGAHAAGTVDVVVTNGIGPSTTGTGLIEYYSPVAETWELLQLPSYTASPWVGVASAGGSGGRDLTEATNPPAASSGRADFDGTNDLLSTAVLMSDIISEAAGSIAIPFFADTAAADAGASATYLNPALFSDTSNGFLQLEFSDSGLRLGSYNGVGWDGPTVACSTGAWHLAQARWNATDMEVRIDNGSWVPMTRTIQLSGDGVKVGSNYDAAFFDGKMGSVMASQDRKSDAVFIKLASWAKQRGMAS